MWNGVPSTDGTSRKGTSHRRAHYHRANSYPLPAMNWARQPIREEYLTSLPCHRTCSAPSYCWEFHMPKGKHMVSADRLICNVDSQQKKIRNVRSECKILFPEFALVQGRHRPSHLRYDIAQTRGLEPPCSKHGMGESSDFNERNTASRPVSVKQVCHRAALSHSV